MYSFFWIIGGRSTMAHDDDLHVFQTYLVSYLLTYFVCDFWLEHL